MHAKKSHMQVWPEQRLANDSRVDPTRPAAVLVCEVLHIEREMHKEELQRAHLALQKSHDLYLDLYESSPVGNVTLAADGSVSEINVVGIRLLGRERNHIVGHRFSSFVCRRDKDQFEQMLSEVFVQGKSQKRPFAFGEDNDAVSAHIHCMSIIDGEPSPIVRMTLTGIGGRAETEIESLVLYDSLTKLPHRQLFLDHLQHALVVCARTRLHGAILSVGLDNLEALLQTVGHAAADLVLLQVAQRLTTCVRESDTVARLGGGEFVVMLQDLSGDPVTATEQARAIGKKMLAALNGHFLVAPDEYRTTRNIGVTLFRNHRECVEDLLQRADSALLAAKKVGGGILRFTELEMQPYPGTQVPLELELRQAVHERQFVLHYQPQVDREGNVTGFEALLRWRHPRRGLLSPRDFIRLAEETGLIVSIGQWVLEAACSQLVAWSIRPDTAHLTLAINVSAYEFRHPQLVSDMLTAVDWVGANPARLMLEITESLMLGSVDAMIAKMKTLRARGIRFALDDFGTGYSSLTYVKKLPLDQLKIDQSFVRGALTSHNDAVIACTITNLGKSLGLAVIAEGIETEDQRNFLAANGCDAYQGFLFGRPVPVESLQLGHA